MKARLLLLAGLLFAVRATALPIPQGIFSPEFDLVDGTSRVDDIYDLVVDAQGRPHIAYIDRFEARSGAVGAVGNARVRYAWFDGWTWRDETLGTLATREDTAVNKGLVLAVGSDGVHVLAIEPGDATFTDDRMVRFHRRLDASVSRVPVASGNVSEPALAIDAAGSVFAAWTRNRVDGRGTSIEFGRLGNGGNLTPFVLPTSNQVSSPSLAARVGITGVGVAWNECEPAGCRQRSARAATGVGQFADITPLTPGGGGDVRIAINAQNQLEAMLVLGTGIRRIEHRVSQNGVWSCAPGQACELALEEGLAADYVPPAHAFVIGNFSPAGAQSTDRAISLRLTSRSTVLVDRFDTFVDAGWQLDAVPPSVRFGAVALGSDGQPLIVGRTDDTHADLLALKLGGPWTSAILPNTTQTMRGALDITSNRDGTPLLLGTAADGNMHLWRWQNGSSPGFADDPLPAALDPESASLALGAGGSAHVAIQERNGGELVYAQRFPGSGQAWQLQRPLGVGISGRAPGMLVYPDGTPAIVYVDAAGNVILLYRIEGVWAQRSLSGSFLPGVSSAPRAVVAGEGQLLRVSWFDPGAGRLMLSSIVGDPATAFISIEPTVNTATSHGRMHDLDLLADGQPLLAYSLVEDEGERLVASYRRSDGSWLPAPGSPSWPMEQLFAVRVAAGGGNANSLRLAWIGRETVGGDRLWFTFSGLAFLFGNVAVPEPTRPLLEMAAGNRVLLALAESSGTTVMRVPEPIPLSGSEVFPPGWTGATQTLPPANVSPVCFCLIAALVNIDCEQLARSGQPSAIPSTMGALQQRFASTDAGRYYLDLFGRHSNEIMALTLADPYRFSERQRTWQDLQPSFAAFVNGDGASVQFRPEQIASARSILEDWAAAGSPELRAAVEFELDRLDNLEVFLGMNFDQWFAALTVGNDAIFGAGFETTSP